MATQLASARPLLDDFISEVGRIRNTITKGLSKQVSSRDEIDLLKSVAYSWFNTERPKLVVLGESLLTSTDTCFRRVIDATGRRSARSTYVESLGNAKNSLLQLRSVSLLPAPPSARTSDAAPDFSPLASDTTMRDILARRWKECERCLSAEAHLAATVMMGGLLEALFVARANHMRDKRPLFQAKSTPLDSRTKKPIPLTEWTLAPYILVAKELGWIAKSAGDVATVLRDYRNYVHPEKERSHGVVLTAEDSSMFWELSKLLARQLLASAKSAN